MSAVHLHEVGIWALMLALFVWAGWCLTEALRYVKPTLRARHRWAAVFWLTAAAATLHEAFEVGAR